ncbi:AAA family ATPase [Actinokineospora globicatena]|uniref:LuxR family transcriptional regulator n=1 Tax=Actinokineospora globicatena TaxID=103729 RepID=A0A9W6QRR0_9PSEU|nr:LuxR family transcriptional regulator [Actinokineospora globicatena]GLW93412.1 LuxR family transcriptional regulator [Actinokineospora globicatena]
MGYLADRGPDCGSAGARVWVRPGGTALVARDRELAEVTEAAKWPPSLVLVEGTAGVGKSRLVAELARRQGVEHWVGARRCDPSRHPAPFGVLVDLLSTYPRTLGALGPSAGAVRPHVPELADRLPPPVPEQARRVVVAGFREVIGALGRVTLVVEDAQWVDKWSRRVLRAVVDHPPAGLTLVLTYRPEQVGPGGPLGTRPGRMTRTRVVVEPLERDGVGRVAAEVVGPVSDAVAAALWRRTAGLPFAVAELVGAVRDPRALTRADDAAAERVLGGLPVPWSVRDEMADQVRGLWGAAAALMRAAAVVAPASAAVLCAVAGVDSAEVERLVRRAVLVETDAGIGFRYPLARQAVYESLPASERRRLHERALAVLGEHLPADQVATHARGAGALREWARHGVRAAEEAMLAGRDDVAVGWLTELVTEPALPAADLARLVTILCGHGLSGARHRELIPVLERLITDQRLSDGARAEVAIGLGLLLMRAPGDLPRADFKIRSAVRTPGVAEAWSLRGVAIFGMPYLGNRSVQECRRWQGLVFSRIGAMAPGPARTALLASMLQSRLTLGDADIADLEDLLPTRVDPDDHEHLRQLGRARCNLADVCAWLGHYDHARALLANGLRGAESAPYVRSTGLGTEVRLDWLAGRWSGLADRAEAIITANPGALPVTGEMRLVQGWLAIAKGDVVRAAACLRETGVADPESAVAPVVLAAMAALSTVAMDRGDVRAACTQVDAGVALLRHQRVWAWSGDLVPAAVIAYTAADRVDDARRLLDQTAAGIAPLDGPYLRAALAAGYAHLAAATMSPEAVAPLYTSVAAQHRALGLPYAAATLTERAALLGAPHSFSDLALEYEDLGAVIAAARCRHHARRAGTPVPSTRGRRGYGRALSPRETEIARLLADGRTNREIADTLFLSRRTVEDHVANILRKHGALTRSAYVTRHGT